MATELLDDGVELAEGQVGGCEFCAHDFVSWANLPVFVFL
jgi:hypothetical protein